MISLLKQPCDEGVIQSAQDQTPCTSQVRRWVLVAAILGSGITFIDGTVVNVALPVLQERLKASVTDAQWIVESYSLFLSALILVGGSLGDRLGRRRMFVMGLMIFAAASMWCGVAPNVRQLIIARGAQGLGAAFLVPGSLALISATFSKQQRGKAIGTWSAFTAITAGAGPVLGGWLIENTSWRWIFFINVPLAAVVLAITQWRVPESRDERVHGPLDWAGAILATLGLGGIVYATIESNNSGFTHPVVLGSGLIGIASLTTFVFVERHAQVPLVPLTLFHSRNFSGANLLTFFLYAALGEFLFFLPFNLIQIQGYSPTAAGAATLPFVLTMFLLSRWSGGLVDRYGARPPLIIGPIITAIGYALFIVPDVGESYWTSFFPAIIVMSLGMTLSVAPLTTTVMGSVDERSAGIASGINNAVSRVAGLLAIAVLGIVVLSWFNNALDQRLHALSLSASIKEEIDQQGSNFAALQIPSDLDPKMKAGVKRAVDESFVAAFRVGAAVAAALALASALTSWFLIDGKKNET